MKRCVLRTVRTDEVRDNFILKSLYTKSRGFCLSGFDVRGFWVLIGPDFSARLTWAFRRRCNFGPVSYIFLINLYKMYMNLKMRN